MLLVHMAVNQQFHSLPDQHIRPGAPRPYDCCHQNTEHVALTRERADPLGADLARYADDLGECRQLSRVSGRECGESSAVGNMPSVSTAPSDVRPYHRKAFSPPSSGVGVACRAPQRGAPAEARYRRRGSADPPERGSSKRPSTQVEVECWSAAIPPYLGCSETELTDH